MTDSAVPSFMADSLCMGLWVRNCITLCPFGLCVCVCGCLWRGIVVSDSGRIWQSLGLASW
jgi:hypothetical protein